MAARRRTLTCAALVATVAPQAPAQEHAVTPTRLAPATEVRIDAHFDEPFWGTAARLSPLRVVEPREGPPRVETVVRLAYDTDRFYLAFECEEVPGEVRARLLARDAQLDPDDRIEFWFDPFGAGEAAYWFQIGAGGSRGDAQISDYGFRFNKSWDGIWSGRARLTPGGWAAEVAIPFKTLAFRLGNETWGFNLRRLRKHGAEEHRWAKPTPAEDFFRLPGAGLLLGMAGMQQGLGLDVVPYAKGSLAADRRADDHIGRTADAGGDVFFRLSPELGAALTVNTDFAETEVDERQVNLTRFPLFFPEKRDFFLDDAPLFEFGIPAPRGEQGSQVRPFFSRRIGLAADGAAVPILLGGKLTGRAGPWNVAALQALLDPEAGGGEALGVARVNRRFGAQSAVGVIGTYGDPDRDSAAGTFGVDARFGDRELFGQGRAGTLWAYAAGSSAQGADDGGAAFGVAGAYESATWEHRVSVQGIERGFAPRLGFVRRTDLWEAAGRHGWTWRNPRPGFVRRVEAQVAPQVTTTYDGGKDGWRVALQPIELTFESDDRIGYEIVRGFERVPERFELRDGVGVAAGDYTTTQHRVELETASARPVWLEAGAGVGTFFGGHLARFSFEPAVYFGRHVQLGCSYEEFRVRVPEGRFVTRLVALRADATFTPDLVWRNLVQFDDDSDRLTWQSRVHWIVQPGTDVYLVALYGWDRDPVREVLQPAEQGLTLKLLHTLRF